MIEPCPKPDCDGQVISFGPWTEGICMSCGHPPMVARAPTREEREHAEHLMASSSHGARLERGSGLAHSRAAAMSGSESRKSA